MCPADYPRVVALNHKVQHLTSPMDRQRLAHLHAVSSYSTVMESGDELAGFLLVMREHDPYENDNHAWFKQRVSRFLYVDRIVVGPRFAGQGIGRQLYEALFAYARTSQVPVITCEYNLQPPNLPSKAFHRSFGFSEIGQRRLPGGEKQVSMQQASVADFMSRRPSAE